MGAHGLGAMRRLRDAGEANFLQCGRKLTNRHALEVGGEARGHGGIDPRARVQQLAQTRQVIADLLGVCGAHLHTFTTGHAGLGDDARLATDDADGLDGTMPNTLVAVLAFVFNGIDGTGHG